MYRPPICRGALTLRKMFSPRVSPLVSQGDRSCSSPSKLSADRQWSTVNVTYYKNRTFMSDSKQSINQAILFTLSSDRQWTIVNITNYSLQIHTGRSWVKHSKLISAIHTWFSNNNQHQSKSHLALSSDVDSVPVSVTEWIHSALTGHIIAI